MSKESKAIVRRWLEEADKGNLDGAISFDTLGLMQQLGAIPSQGQAQN